MEKQILMFTHLWELTKKVAATGYGWVLAGGAFVFNYFASEGGAFTLVICAILFDALFGLMVAVKYNKFILSKLGRVTMFKITSYFAPLVILFMIEKLAHDSGFFGVKIAAAIAAACELWSMSAHILILWPEAAFFKIFRKHLKAEIAAKIGDPLDDIFKEDENNLK